MSSTNERRNDGNGKVHLKFAILAAALAAGIVGAAFAAGLGSNTALAQASDSNQTDTSTNSSATVPAYPGHYYQAPSTVSTSGSASTKVKPDKFSVTLGVETNGTTAKEAADRNAELMDKVLSALRGLGIDDEQIGTSNYNVYPVYDYGMPSKPCIDIYPPPPDCQPSQNITGYRASNSVTVTLDVNGSIDAGQVIDTAVNAGANNVNGVYFFVSQDRQEEVRDGLIKQAIDNAKHRAEIAADALGLTVTGVQSISLNDAYFPVFYKDMAAGAAESAPTQIMPGEQEVTMSVNAVFLFSDDSMPSGNQTSTVPSGMTSSLNNPDCVNPPGGPMIC